MEDIRYITDSAGRKTGLLVNLIPRKKITLEYIETLQDIIAFELLKIEESVDYLSSIEKIIRDKKSNA